MTVGHHPNPKSEESSRYREPMSDSQWQALRSKLARELRELNGNLVERLVEQIQKDIEWLDGHMTRYCEITCPACTDPCCLAQNIFYNRADLLYLVGQKKAATPGPIGEQSSPAPSASRYRLHAFEGPSGQTRRQTADPCRYLAQHGCLLPRIQRPYVCVWFLCEPQMELFACEPAAFQRQFIDVLKNIRTHRLQLESLYEQSFPG